MEIKKVIACVVMMVTNATAYSMQSKNIFDHVQYAIETSNVDEFKQLLKDLDRNVLKSRYAELFQFIICVCIQNSDMTLFKELLAYTDKTTLDRYFLESIAYGKEVLESCIAEDIAVKYNDICDVLAEFITAGVDVNGKGYEGETPVIVAAFKFPLIAGWLIDHGALVNASTVFGVNALMMSFTDERNNDVVKLLLKKGINIHAQDVIKRTALHRAARYDDGLEAVKLLVAHGADIYKQDIHGKTAFDYAAYYQRYDIMRFLKQCHHHMRILRQPHQTTSQEMQDCLPKEIARVVVAFNVS